MNEIKYKFLKNENELKDKIDILDKMAKSQLVKVKELYIEDLYFMSLIDKSIKLIASFLFAFGKRNITVLATLTRVQIDCTLRAFATTMVDDSSDFCKAILVDSKKVNELKDKHNRKMTDRYLCECVGEYLNLPVYDLYKKVSGFVHFSSDSFYNISKAHEKYDISMFISRKNREEDRESFERISIELANQFLFFGLVLIEDIFYTWIEQKMKWQN